MQAPLADVSKEQTMYLRQTAVLMACAVAASPELRRTVREAVLRTSKKATGARGHVEPREANRAATVANGVVA